MSANIKEFKKLKPGVKQWKWIIKNKDVVSVIVDDGFNILYFKGFNEGVVFGDGRLGSLLDALDVKNVDFL